MLHRESLAWVSMDLIILPWYVCLFQPSAKVNYYCSQIRPVYFVAKMNQSLPNPCHPETNEIVHPIVSFVRILPATSPMKFPGSWPILSWHGAMARCICHYCLHAIFWIVSLICWCWESIWKYRSQIIKACSSNCRDMVVLSGCCLLSHDVWSRRLAAMINLFLYWFEITILIIYCFIRYMVFFINSKYICIFVEFSE